MIFTNYRTLKLKDIKFVRFGGNDNLIIDGTVYYNAKVLKANFARGRNGETEGEMLIQHGISNKDEIHFVIIGDNKARSFKPRSEHA